jgi:hypothetical protein
MTRLTHRLISGEPSGLGGKFGDLLVGDSRRAEALTQCVDLRWWTFDRSFSPVCPSELKQDVVTF